MERIPAVLLLALALYAVGIFCAPIATPPPSPVSTPAPVNQNEGAKKSSSSLANVEDVMMDPSAKLRKFCDNRRPHNCQSQCPEFFLQAHKVSSLPLSCNHVSVPHDGMHPYILFYIAWQKQEGDITYLTDKFLWPEDPDDPFFELPAAAGEQRSKRAAVKNRYRRWTNGVVPYIISDAYTGTV